MATTLDHLSNGRAILGIGAAWFDEEHAAFGLEFGSGPPERRWLGEALPIMRGMLDGEPTARGPRYSSKATRNLPAPVQAHLPICVGGGGEQVTLKLVARYADMNNVGGGIASVRRKEEILLRHCETVGRDPSTIERSAALGPVFIRDSRAEAEQALKAAFERNGGAEVWPDLNVGTPEDVAERLAPFVELGYRTHRGLSIAARRGVDDAAYNRGSAAVGAGPRDVTTAGCTAAALRPRPVAGRLGPVAAARHVAPAALAATDSSKKIHWHVSLAQTRTRSERPAESP